MKYSRCKICGTRVCFNNFSDHKPRSELYRLNGVFICRGAQCKKMVPIYLYIKKEAAKGKPKAGKLLQLFPTPPYPGGR